MDGALWQKLLGGTISKKQVILLLRVALVIAPLILLVGFILSVQVFLLKVSKHRRGCTYLRSLAGRSQI